jgi:surface polysaccharide O-acyltransferase-like enzyme
MITGALLLHREYEIGSFLKKRLSRVVIPFLFWSLVYVWYSWYSADGTVKFGPDAWANVKQVLHLLKYGSSYHLWYVYMLIGLYFFIPVIGKFVRNASEKEILYFLFVWFGVMLITQPYLSRYNPAVDMHYFAGFAGYLVLGHYLAFKEFNAPNLRWWMALLFIVSVAVIAVGSWWLYTYKTYPGTMFYEPVNPAIVALSASIFIFFKYSMPKVSPVIIRIRDFAGKYNYGIYLAHALVLYFLDDPFDFCGKYFEPIFNYLFKNNIPYDFSISYKLCTPIVSIPLTALAAFGISLLLVWLVNKIPLVGKWISG